MKLNMRWDGAMVNEWVTWLWYLSAYCCLYISAVSWIENECKFRFAYTVREHTMEGRHDLLTWRNAVYCNSTSSDGWQISWFLSHNRHADSSTAACPWVRGGRETAGQMLTTVSFFKVNVGNMCGWQLPRKISFVCWFSCFCSFWFSRHWTSVGFPSGPPPLHLLTICQNSNLVN